MIHFLNRSTVTLKQEYPRLRKAVHFILKQVNMDPKSNQMTVLFTSDPELERLNRTYREMKGPTDVLSFPSDDVDPETGIRYLGDIAISMDQVRNQHISTGDDEKDILLLLVAHGTLHLLGYDHGTVTEKKEMWSRQAEALSEFYASVQITE